MTPLSSPPPGSLAAIASVAGPPTSRAHRTKRARAVRPGAAPRRTIVIVESDPRLSEVLGEALLELLPDGVAGAPLTIVAVSRGQAAIALFDRAQPDLVILDLLLEDIDAREVLNKLERDRRLSRVPVVLTSATGAFEAIGRQRVAATLHKPFAMRELERAVLGALPAHR